MTGEELLNRIKGTWFLQSWTYQDEDGEVQHFFGPDPEGILMFDGNGWMNVQVTKPKRTKFAEESIAAGTSEEMGMAFTTYFAYYGTYKLGEKPNILEHEVKGALFPNWLGNKQIRYVSFEGELLVLQTPPVQTGTKSRVFSLKWRKSK